MADAEKTGLGAKSGSGKKFGKLRAKLDSGAMSAQEAAVTALNHRLRVTLLTIYTERPASPSDLEDLGVDTLSNLAYHTRVLWELRQIEIVDEIQRRGATEHVYRAINIPLFSNPDWEKFDPKVRRAISSYGVGEIFKDVSSALTAGTFDTSTKRHLSRARLSLDQRGWLEANAVQNEALERILEIAEEADGRLQETGEAPVSAVSAMACFQMPPRETEADG